MEEGKCKMVMCVCVWSIRIEEEVEGRILMCKEDGFVYVRGGNPESRY